MSFEDVDTALKADIESRRGVSVATMKLVLIAIAQHTSAKRGDHEAFPALKRLAKMTGLSQASVSNAVDALEETEPSRSTSGAGEGSGLTTA
jgi:DNA-binding MarR family transcriptional regulator